MLLDGPAGEPLFLQAKEAEPSVVQTYGRMPPAAPPGVHDAASARQGYRVVTGQRILQAQSDPFLGWVTGATPASRTGITVRSTTTGGSSGT